MAEEKKINNDEELKKDEELEKEEKQEKEPEDQDKKDLPAKTETDEKKGFHPIQALKSKAKEFGDNHPKIVSGAKTTGKVAVGVVVGAVGTVAVLASIAKNRADDVEDESYEDDETDDENVIDSEATELDE